MTGGWWSISVDLDFIVYRSFCAELQGEIWGFHSHETCILIDWGSSVTRVLEVRRFLFVLGCPLPRCFAVVVSLALPKYLFFATEANMYAPPRIGVTSIYGRAMCFANFCVLVVVAILLACFFLRIICNGDAFFFLWMSCSGTFDSVVLKTLVTKPRVLYLTTHLFVGAVQIKSKIVWKKFGTEAWRYAGHYRICSSRYSCSSSRDTLSRSWQRATPGTLYSDTVPPYRAVVCLAGSSNMFQAVMSQYHLTMMSSLLLELWTLLSEENPCMNTSIPLITCFLPADECLEKRLPLRERLAVEKNMSNTSSLFPSHSSTRKIALEFYITQYVGSKLMFL